MISEPTKKRLLDSINNPMIYCSGKNRKILQATFDKMLDEVSINLFEAPCTNRMLFRQRVNSLSSDTVTVKALKQMLKNQDLLFSKDYRDHNDEILKFITNDLTHFLKEICSE